MYDNKLDNIDEMDKFLARPKYTKTKSSRNRKPE